MTENSEARKRHKERDAQDCAICHSTEHAPGWHFTDTVTVTIRREDATWLYELVDDTVDRFFDRRPDFDRPHQRCMVAIQQALDADR